MYIYKVKIAVFERYSILCYGNFLDNRTLVYLIKQTFYVHFVESINWLGLYHSYKWIIQSLEIVSVILLYHQMIAL